MFQKHTLVLSFPAIPTREEFHRTINPCLVASDFYPPPDYRGRQRGILKKEKPVQNR